MTPEEKKRLRRSYILTTISILALIINFVLWLIGRSHTDIPFTDYYKDTVMAVQDAQRFRTAKVIKIPYSLQFDSKHLRTLTGKYDYIRFYFGLKDKGDILTLLAIGVDNKNGEDDKLTDQGTANERTNIVEFADPCPVCKTTDASGGVYKQQRSLLFPFHPDSLPKEMVFTFYSKDGCPK